MNKEHSLKSSERSKKSDSLVEGKSSKSRGRSSTIASEKIQGKSPVDDSRKKGRGRSTTHEKDSVKGSKAAS